MLTSRAKAFLAQAAWILDTWSHPPQVLAQARQQERQGKRPISKWETAVPLPPGEGNRAQSSITFIAGERGQKKDFKEYVIQVVFGALQLIRNQKGQSYPLGLVLSQGTLFNNWDEIQNAAVLLSSINRGRSHSVTHLRHIQSGFSQIQNDLSSFCIINRYLETSAQQ